MISFKRFFFLITSVACLLQPVQSIKESKLKGYLFVYFTGNGAGQEAIHYAYSSDGFSYHALNGNRPILDSKAISQTGGVRDPHILRAQNGWFYMVATDMKAELGWDSNRAMTLLKSRDLIHWTASTVNIQQKYAGQDDLKRVWAPQTIYDPQTKKYLIYWSMKYGNGPDKIYWAYANQDFTDLEGTPQLFFTPQDGKSCIDGDIIAKDGHFYLFYKTEGHGNGIKVASSNHLTANRWQEQPDYKQQTTEAVEGAGTFKLIGQDKYILMYDVYMNGRYEFTETTDLIHFQKVSNPIQMDFHPRHGTVLPITAKELARLNKAFPN